MGTRRRAIAAVAVLLLFAAGVVLRLALRPAAPAGDAEPHDALPAHADRGAHPTASGDGGDEARARSARRRRAARPREDVAQTEAQAEALRGLGYIAKQRAARQRLADAAPKVVQPSAAKDGLVFGRTPEGATYLRGRLVAGKREGLWTDYHPKGGRTESEYRDGVRHGAEASWHPDGRPKFLGEYADGEMSGTWTSWHDTGAVLAVRSYVDGKLHGWVRTFHANGRLEEESFFDVGRETGTNRGWHENGLLAWEIEYEDGRRSGSAVWYDEQGLLTSDGTYLAGKLHGDWTAYRSDGSVVRVEIWEHGELR